MSVIFDHSEPRDSQNRNCVIRNTVLKFFKKLQDHTDNLGLYLKKED